MRKMIILKGAQDENTSAAVRFKEKVNEVANDSLVEIVAYRDLLFTWVDGDVTLTAPHLQKRLEDLGDYFYIRDYRGYERERYAVARYLSNKGKEVSNQDLQDTETISKLEQMTALALAGVSVPNGQYGDLTVHADTIQSFPVIAKGIVAANGQDNYLLYSRAELEPLSKDGTKYIIQSYIENDGDYRVIILFGEPLVTYIRTSTGESHLNNVAHGASRTLVNEPAVDALARKAALALKRENCGVDIIRDKNTGKLFVLECNFNNGMHRLGDEVEEAYYLSAAKAIAQRLS